MAFDLEIVTLVGKIQPRDSEIRYTPAGLATVSFSLVCSRGKFNKETTSWENESDWFRVTAFGERFEKQSAKLVKGAHVLVSGKFAIREYEAKSGEKRQSVEVTANEIVVLSAPAESTESSDTVQETVVPF